jgi:hypothetical protein
LTRVSENWPGYSTPEEARMARPSRGDPRSRTPGFLRRVDKQGRNRAWVYDVTEDRYVEVSESGRVSDKRLEPGEIPVEVAEVVYEDGQEEEDS